MFDQTIPTESIITLVEMLKMLPEDLNNVREALINANERQLWIFVNVLHVFGVMDQSLNKLKSLLAATLSAQQFVEHKYLVLLL